MSEAVKWIGGVLGWILWGPIGGILGFFIGTVIDVNIEMLAKPAGARAGDAATIDTGDRNSFLLSLLVLSSAVMKADGRVMRSELHYVQAFISRNFGNYAVPQATQILKGLLNKKIDIEEVALQIRTYMPPADRIQLLHYLVGIAQSDNAVSAAELEMLRRIAAALYISRAESESIFAMFEGGIEAAYQVLEISPDVSDEEVKKAYKRMAVKHHPDKVAHLGHDIQMAATEKFKKISEAYEKIKKERNMQ